VNADHIGDSKKQLTFRKAFIFVVMERVRLAGKKDLVKIKSMTDMYIGTDFYTMQQLEDFIESPDKLIFVFANEDDEVVSYVYTFISTYGKALETLNIPQALDILPGVSQDEIVGVYKTSCTDKRYRGRGNFSIMVTVMDQIFKKHGPDHIIIPALEYRTGEVPVKYKVDHMGFKFVTRLAHPWSDIYSYCPYCGHDYCQCDCIIYTREKEKA
jgi:hypothetical protein